MYSWLRTLQLYHVSWHWCKCYPQPFEGKKKKFKKTYYCGSALTCSQLLRKRQYKCASVKDDTNLCLWAKRAIKLNTALIKKRYLLLIWRLLLCHYIQLMNFVILIIAWKCKIISCSFHTLEKQHIKLMSCLSVFWLL